jgi:predicted ArsR family transcriptional regulator
MSSKAASEKRFDEILRRMLQSKPLSRSEISARIQVRRQAARIKK